MALSFETDLKRKTNADDKPRLLIYGPPKLGKTTLANEFPNAFFVQTESGATEEGVSTFGLSESLDHVREAMKALLTQPHDFQWLVFDSLDKLEPLVHDFVCAENNWKTIEDPGYGKGYNVCDGVWRNFIAGTNKIRLKRNMGVIFLAHDEIKQVDDPRTASYSRYDIRLHKRAVGLFSDEVDAIICLNLEANVQDEKQGFGKVRKVAKGGVQRWLYSDATPAMRAGSRFNIPTRIRYVKGKGYEELSKYLPGGSEFSLKEQAAPEETRVEATQDAAA